MFKLKKSEIWFYMDNEKICILHRTAYEKSLKCDHAVKVHDGEYYYKGYQISKDGGRDYPWNYGRPDEISHEAAQTKKEAMETINFIINQGGRNGN